MVRIKRGDLNCPEMDVMEKVTLRKVSWKMYKVVILIFPISSILTQLFWELPKAKKE